MLDWLVGDLSEQRFKQGKENDLCFLNLSLVISNYIMCKVLVLIGVGWSITVALFLVSMLSCHTPFFCACPLCLMIFNKISTPCSVSDLAIEYYTTNILFTLYFKCVMWLLMSIYRKWDRKRTNIWYVTGWWQHLGLWHDHKEDSTVCIPYKVGSPVPPGRTDDTCSMYSNTTVAVLFPFKA